MTTNQTQANLLDNLFAGTGEMAQLMRSHDWSQTPLGPVEQWPQSLRTTVSILLSSRYPMFTFWGPQLVKLYNDAYRPVLGATKHPSALGKPAAETWSDIWEAIGPLVDQVITQGEATWSDNMVLFMQRSGYVEETYFTFSYSPIRDETGGVGGLFCACTETTQQVLSDRRLRTLRDLAAQTGLAKTSEAACQIATNTLANNPADIPFALLYLLDAEEQSAHLAGITGLEPGTPSSPTTISLADPAAGWPLAGVMQTNQVARVEDVLERFGPLSVGPWEESPHTALVLPVASPGQERPTGLLVAGISARRALDDDYQGFLELVAGQVATAIADARAYEAERQRAEALAELDRAKTIFFSNVSHEFRTPLTLILAPLEDALSSLNTWDTSTEPSPGDPQPPALAVLTEQLQLAQRNGRRLLKLVNTLLDFSRIEAGRIEAVYEPTDLATLTADLASMFRSLTERAGLSLAVDCPPLPEAIYVDRDLWEKIVLNLLSNAFKFTFTGAISVRLRVANALREPAHPPLAGPAAILEICDTGIGIPASEIPHLFKRFHRVKGAQGRSFEGSGIGLSLVQELVKLHGGTIHVTSELGRGTCVTVTIPTGIAHLPSDRIGATRTLGTATGATPYLEEAWGWVAATTAEASTLDLADIHSPDRLEAGGPTTPTPQRRSPVKLLVVDDNADVREYLQRLLQPHYTVETACDGLEALISLQQHHPDLILTDVMMPRLDGFGLLKAIRTDPATRALPVILLSARAGEESRVEGLEAGADDYLIKPFSSRELMARIEANLKMAQIRQTAAAREQALRLTAEQAQQETATAFERLTQLLETMSDAFIELDQDWRIIYQNAAAKRMLAGQSRSQIVGENHWDIWPDLVGTEIELRYRQAIATQTPVHFEYRYYAPPQFDFWVEIDAYPSRGGLGIFFRDITQRKQTEGLIREREAMLQLFFKYVPSGVAMFDRQMHYLMASQRWIEDYHLGSVETVLGRSHYELFPEISDDWKHIHQRCLAGATEHRDADCLVHSDGSLQWVRWEVRPWYQPNHEIGGIIIFAEDITQRREAELALEDSKLQLQRQLAEIEAIYQSAPIGLNVLDTDLRFIRINQRLAEMYGLSVEAHIGRTVRELLPELADSAERLLRPILETGEPLLNVEICGETPAQPGVKRFWLESFLPLKDGDRVIGISTVCEEITERKRQEQQRQQTQESLRRAKAKLEIRVIERTLELQSANERLSDELHQRAQIEQQLRQSEARYRAIVEDQTELIVRFAPDSTILFVNAAFCRYFGVQATDIIGYSYNPVIYAADRQKVAEQLQSMTLENPVLVIENRVVNGQGEVRWTQWANRMLFDAEENLTEFQAVGRDITDLKQAEQALRQSKERLQLALEASGDGIWDWNIVTDEVYFSPQYFQMLGYAPEELPHLLSTWQSLVHPDDMVWVQELLLRHFQDYTVRYEFDYRLRTKTGDWKWIADYGKVVAWDETGNPLRMIGTHRDIHDRKRIEAALRLSEEQRRLALDLTHLGFWDLHIASDDLTWNDNLFQLLGLTPSLEKPHYTDWRDRVHPDDIAQVEQQFFHSVETHTDYEAEYRVLHPDGTERWLLGRGRAIYDEQNQPVRSLGVLLDISDRKYIEASLQESDRRWRSLLDNVQLVVIELKLNGQVEYVNPFFLELTGYQLHEVLGQYWFEQFLPTGQQPRVEGAFQEVLEHNFHTHYQNPILTKAGEERMIAWSNTVLRDAAGLAIGTISIGEDITERYNVERMKAEFISVVSHELRTPLTSMQAALSLLSEKIIDPTSDEGEATIQIATEGTDRLVRLVNDILDLERLESGKVRLDKRPCKVYDLVDTAVAQMQEMANQAGITLVASPCTLQVHADGDRILQVLTNLLSNAIKFSPGGSTIWLNVEAIASLNKASQPSTPAILFSVKDQGRGIPVEKLESVFDRFHQVDASDSREKGGTGLGLAICRSIVRQHGGEIWAESTIGQGSTFYFTVPVGKEL